jgi:hypothetical protein
MSGRFQPLNGADSAVTYRVSLRSLDSDHTFTQLIEVYGPRGMQRLLDDLKDRYPNYSVGTPREVA